jgi:4-carboxymuconolactone decarboxylase
LEAIEIALPEAGVVAFQHGFNVWCDVVGATGIDPSAGLLRETPD